jgi:hypothetical protein
MQHYCEINLCFEFIRGFQYNIDISMPVYHVPMLRHDVCYASASCMFVSVGLVLLLTLTPNAFMLPAL